MKIYLASDHAGVDLKKYLIDELSKSHKDNEYIDLGPNSKDSVDYPDYAHPLCEKVLEDDRDRGVLICGSGQGMSISANKHQGIRAALVWNKEIAQLSREHNNSNVLVLGERFSPKEDALEFTKVWLDTDFAGGRHERRVNKIDRC